MNRKLGKIIEHHFVSYEFLKEMILTRFDDDESLALEFLRQFQKRFIDRSKNEAIVVEYTIINNETFWHIYIIERLEFKTYITISK